MVDGSGLLMGVTFYEFRYRYGFRDPSDAWPLLTVIESLRPVSEPY